MYRQLDVQVWDKARIRKLLSKYTERERQFSLATAPNLIRFVAFKTKEAHNIERKERHYRQMSCLRSFDCNQKQYYPLPNAPGSTFKAGEMVEHTALKYTINLRVVLFKNPRKHCKSFT